MAVPFFFWLFAISFFIGFAFTYDSAASAKQEKLLQQKFRHESFETFINKFKQDERYRKERARSSNVKSKGRWSDMIEALYNNKSLNKDSLDKDIIIYEVRSLRGPTYKYRFNI